MNFNVLAINARDKYSKIRQGSMTLLDSYDKVKIKFVAMERAGAYLVETSIVAEIAVANRHDAPADSDCREAEDYAVAVCLVLQPNCPGIAEDDAVLV